jgi:hypothetical protein
MSFDDFVAGLPDIDWEDALSGHRAAAALLEEAATSGMVPERLERLGSQPQLLARCEHLMGLDKLVLHDDAGTGVRLRLHVFGEHYEDLPHNHRWSYASRIIRGGYDQLVHGTVSTETAPAELRSMRAVFATHFGAGTSHFLHHSAVHSLHVRPHTISLILRGPSVRDHALWNDRASGQVWLHRGGASDERKRVMSPEEAVALSRRLAALDLWSRASLVAAGAGGPA